MYRLRLLAKLPRAVATTTSTTTTTTTTLLDSAATRTACRARPYSAAAATTDASDDLTSPDQSTTTSSAPPAPSTPGTTTTTASTTTTTTTSSTPSPSPPPPRHPSPATKPKPPPTVFPAPPPPRWTLSRHRAPAPVVDTYPKTWHVSRTASKNLPVYPSRNLRTSPGIMVSKIAGSVRDLKADMIREMGFAEDRVTIRPVPGHVVVKTKDVNEAARLEDAVKAWLESKGY